jgi:hypothetical protein
MAISNGFFPLNFSVESLVLREIVPKKNAKERLSTDAYQRVVIRSFGFWIKNKTRI